VETRTIGWLLLGAALACGCSGDATSEEGADAGRVSDAGAPDSGAAGPYVTRPLRVDGRFLRDEADRAVFLHGVNVSNRAKGDFPLHVGSASPEAMAQIAGWGFDSIRLLTFWGAVLRAPEGAGPDALAPHAAYLSQLDDMIGWAADAGLRVVLDMHQDVFGFGFGHNGAPPAGCDPASYEGFRHTSPWFFAYFHPGVRACFDALYGATVYRAAFVEAWRLLAARYRGDGRVVAFDLINEPNEGSYAPEGFLPDRLLPFYEVVVDAIRAEDPERLVAAQPHTVVLFGEGMRSARFDRPGVLWAPHYYHPHSHEGQAYRDSTREDLVDAPIARHVAYGDAVIGGEGAAHWFGEFGTPPVEGEVAFARDVLAAFDRHLASWAVWAHDPGGFGLLRGDGTPRYDYLAELLRPHPRAVAGTPLSAVWADGTLRLEHETQPGVAGETVLWAGATRASLAGEPRTGEPEVTSTDPDGAWSYEVEGGLVRVRHDPETARHTLTVRP